MAEGYTTLYVKNITEDRFREWLNNEIHSYPLCTYGATEGWDFYVEIDCGPGRYFWEALALKMTQTFEGMVFEGVNDLLFDDHCVRTFFDYTENELTLTRHLDLPECFSEDFEEDFDEEPEEDIEFCQEDDDERRAMFEDEYDIPYLVKFSSNDIKICFGIYEQAKNILKKAEELKALCNEHKISVDMFMQFVTIIDYEKRN